MGALRFFLFFLMISSAEAQVLKVLSWNTFMLPWPIKESQQEVRTRVISSALQGQDYDFVFMQEAFMGSFRESVGKTLKKAYPHQYYLDRSGIFYPFFGSGLFILGRRPFTVLDKVYFEMCGDYDCWASKGAVLIESQLSSGRSVQVAVTHLQAKEDFSPVRRAQLLQVKALLGKFKRTGVPQLFIGDLNIDGKGKEFREGLDLLGMNAAMLTGPLTHTNVIDCYKKPDHPRMWIDHMWVDRETRIKDPAISVRVVEFKHAGKTCMASDHHAVEGRFTFSD